MDQVRFTRDRGLMAWLWIAFVVTSSLGLSRAFACATPFAAVAVVAALTLPSRRAPALVLLVWLGNQAIGFGLMHYPRDASTFGWGAAIGLAAVVSLGAASSVRLRWARLPPAAQAALALVAAYASYELVLVTATLGLPSESGAFAPAVVLRLFGINAAALGLFLASHRLATVVGLPPTPATALQDG